MRRRTLLKSALAGAAVAVAAPALLRAAGAPLAMDSFAALERRHGGRLGVAVLDTGSGRHVAHRGDERFLMCSTFKLLLAAAVLERCERGDESLDRRITFDKSALLEWAPVTSRHVGAPGLTVAELCAAAMEDSDNTAANLLLARIGGPQAVTRYARGLGDPVTRLDRTDPTLNRPDGERDTTTPDAMLADMRSLLLGSALGHASRERLAGWMLACRTGAQSLRAGLPPDWREGDKTGSGDTATNDVAILWPPRRKPVLVAAYYENAKASDEQRHAVLAAVGRIIATA